MFSIIAYACASFYFILSNFSNATNLALNLVKSIPIVQSTPLLMQVENTIQDVILKSPVKRAAASGALSLLVYPTVVCINEIVQCFIDWLAFFGFFYLSLSQSPQAHKRLFELLTQALQTLKEAAPESFQTMLAINTRPSLTAEKKEL